MQRSSRAASVAAGVLSVVGSAWAAPSADGLQQVVITASRRAEPLERVLATVSLVDRAALETRQYRSVEQAIAELPGVTIANNGGVGKATSLFIRGAESDHSLVLVDGLRWASTTLGTAALQDFPVELIERIELVRGPRSALYGADALGGVVQIITRRPAATAPLRSEATLGYGARGTARASATVGAAGSTGSWQLAGSMLESDGTNACRGFGAPIFAGCFTNEPDADGYRNRSLALRGGLDLGERLELGVHATYTDGRVEYDGSFTNRTEFAQLIAGASFDYSLARGGRVRFALGRTTDDTENYRGASFRGATFVSRFDTRRDQASLTWESAADQPLTWITGVDWRNDRVAATTNYAERARRNLGAFVHGEWTHDMHSIALGVRRDDDEQFGGETTGSLAWGWSLAQSWRLTASVATGYKAPTFNELYFPGFGNPDLDPERSVAAEASLRWRRAAASVTVSAYQNRIDDLIGFDASFRPVNIDAARIRGLELEARTALGPWQLAGFAEWLDPENRSAGANRGKLLPRRAEERLRAEVAYVATGWQLGAGARYEGRRFDNLANTRRVPGFTTVDLRAEWRPTAALRLQARLDNALDRRYETAAFYPQPGREWHVTVRYALTGERR